MAYICSKQGKRRRASDSEEDEQIAKAHDLAQNRTPGANMLNNSLSRTYSSNAAQPGHAENGVPSENKAGDYASPVKRKLRRVVKETSSKYGDDVASDKLDALVARPTTRFVRARSVPSTARSDLTIHLRYSDLGGIEGILQDVRELIEYPLTHPEIYAHLGVEPPRGKGSPRSVCSLSAFPTAAVAFALSFMLGVMIPLDNPV